MPAHVGSTFAFSLGGLNAPPGGRLTCNSRTHVALLGKGQSTAMPDRDRSLSRKAQPGARGCLTEPRRWPFSTWKAPKTRGGRGRRPGRTAGKPPGGRWARGWRGLGRLPVHAAAGPRLLTAGDARPPGRAPSEPRSSPTPPGRAHRRSSLAAGPRRGGGRCRRFFLPGRGAAASGAALAGGRGRQHHGGEAPRRARGRPAGG